MELREKLFPVEELIWAVGLGFLSLFVGVLGFLKMEDTSQPLQGLPFWIIAGLLCIPTCFAILSFCKALKNFN